MRHATEGRLIVAVWSVTGLLVLAWSLLSWALHALLTSPDPWVLAWVQSLAPESWLAGRLAQFPGGHEHVVLVVEWARWIFSWVRGVAPWLAWAVWGTGTAALITAGLVASLVVVLWRSAQAASRLPPQSPPGAS